jgi:mono/diheme cytochrome c family protein/uncharacterized membrane protein
MEMPAQRGEISEEQVGDLVAYVRAFARVQGKPGDTEKGGPALASFNKRYQRLQHEMNDLRRQYHELPKADPGGAPSKPSEPGKPKVVQRSAREASAPREVAELFRQRCVKCHGADGTGNKARERFPDIPDFTKATWQARRDDSKLVASILDGKGEDMPAQRGKLSEEQARGLVTYVRSFVLTKGKQRQAEPEGTVVAEPEDTEPPTWFFPKLIRWLGKFHPVSVHFPIALTTAAAVSELLGIVTGMAAFRAITRYCLWFGALTALAAGTLGWFLGGFRLTDSSWVLMTHRWLGTSTVACAGLVLALSEVSLRQRRPWVRSCFVVTLFTLAVLVSVTGFFGGALVYGLKHYTWPR